MRSNASRHGGAAEAGCCGEARQGLVKLLAPPRRSRKSEKLRPQSISDCSTAVPSDSGNEDDPHGAHTSDFFEEHRGQPRSCLPSFLRAPEQHSEPLIIFDWDDTLFPTSYLFSLPMTKEGDVDIPLDECVVHAGLVRDVLRAARAVARVAIVTLSERPWVPQSAGMLLPELELEQLLLELDVSVYYAAEHGGLHGWPRTPRGSAIAGATPEEKEERNVALKRAAMARCVEQALSSAKRGASSTAGVRNVISIGDSDVEKRALKEVLEQGRAPAPGASTLRPSCKTVKLIADPSLEDLGRQLLFLTPRLQQLVARPAGFDEIVEELM